MDVYDIPTFRGGVLLREMSTPDTPASGTLALFTGTDGYVYAKNDAGQVWGIRPRPLYANHTTDITSLDQNSYGDYAGQPSITFNVPNSGMVRVTFGLKGSHSTAGSSVRVAVVWTGHAANDTGGAVILGAGTGTKHVIGQRTTLFTGLTPGSLNMKLQATTSNNGGEHLEESWLVVQPIP